MQQIAALGYTGFVTHEYTLRMGSDPVAGAAERDRNL
jgi:hypothetical protein